MYDPCIRNKYDIISAKQYDITFENNITNELMDVISATIDTTYNIQSDNKSHVVTITLDEPVDRNVFERIKSNISQYSLTIWARPSNTDARKPIVKYINLHMEIYQNLDQRTLRMYTDTVKYD